MVRKIHDTSNSDLQNFPSKITDDYWVYAISKTYNQHHRKIDKYENEGGKWLIFESLDKIDEVWQKIKKATEEGILGHASKCSTAKPNPNSISPNNAVICVYTYNCKDEDDVFRVEKNLRNLGITKTIYYKTNYDTAKGKYKKKGDKYISKYISLGTSNNKNPSLINLHNVGNHKIKILNKMGIYTIEDLINYQPFKTSNYNHNLISIETLNELKLKAIAQTSNIIFQISPFILPFDNVIYYDIETDYYATKYSEKKIWAIGVYHNQNFLLFLAENYEKEKKILTEFLDYIRSFNKPNLICYSGFQFDKRIIIHALKRNSLDYHFFENLSHFDVCTIIKKSFILPTKSYSLKEVGKLLNYNFKHNLDGLMVSRMYDISQKNNDVSFHKKISEYIEDDVKAIHHIILELKYNRENIKDLTTESINLIYNGNKISLIQYTNELKCPYCGQDRIIRNGKSKYRKYRYYCKNCKKTFSSSFNLFPNIT